MIDPADETPEDGCADCGEPCDQELCAECQAERESSDSRADEIDVQQQWWDANPKIYRDRFGNILPPGYEDQAC